MWTDAARERYKDDGRRISSDLTDAEWETIEPVLRSYAMLTANLREMLNACPYLEKAGCPWRYLPREFAPWQTVRNWHDRFRADGLWSDIATLLTRAVRAQQGRAAEPTTAILDSQSVTSGPQKRPSGIVGNKLMRSTSRLLRSCRPCLPTRLAPVLGSGMADPNTVVPFPSREQATRPAPAAGASTSDGDDQPAAALEHDSQMYAADRLMRELPPHSLREVGATGPHSLQRWCAAGPPWPTKSSPRSETRAPEVSWTC